MFELGGGMCMFEHEAICDGISISLDLKPYIKGKQVLIETKKFVVHGYGFHFEFKHSVLMTLSDIEHTIVLLDDWWFYEPKFHTNYS